MEMRGAHGYKRTRRILVVMELFCILMLEVSNFFPCSAFIQVLSF